MKKLLLFISMLLSITCAAQQKATQTDSKRTFVVDEGLTAPKKDFNVMSADLIAKKLEEENKGVRAIAYSFANDNLCSFGSDNFFKCMVNAYADHRPIILSPDIIWTLIAQGFNQHVNHNPEALRDKIVDHQGKMELTVTSDEDLHSPNIQWDKFLDVFDQQIATNTKDNLADVMRADFSTTDKTARIVSQMTLMSSVKVFFKYSVIVVACGIPNITIEGTPDDWRKVKEKANQLRKYDLDWWIDDLTPILNEFIKASEGKVNKSFWKNIVKKKRVNELDGGGCSHHGPTQLDGWFLKLMPFCDEEGKRTPESVAYNKNMPSQVISVDFMCHKVGVPQETSTPMEMLCGFVGIEIDPVTQAMRPKLGWMVCEKDKQVELEKITDNTVIVTEIPEMLQWLEYEPAISLAIPKSKIKFPEWFSQLKVDRIRLLMKKSDAMEKELREMFPDRIVTVKKAKYFEAKDCNTEYIIQAKKSFEPENHLWSANKLRKSIKHERAKFPQDESAQQSKLFRDYEREFIEKNRRIPTRKFADAYDRHTNEISVLIELTVEVDGTISGYEIRRIDNTATPEMKQEALRIASILPKYTPAAVTNIEGEPMHNVRSKRLFIVNF